MLSLFASSFLKLKCQNTCLILEIFGSIIRKLNWFCFYMSLKGIVHLRFLYLPACFPSHKDACPSLGLSQCEVITFCARGDRQVCQRKVWSQLSLEKMWWTFSTALNHLLNRQHAVIAADFGRSVLSGDFSSRQYMILVYLDLMDMPFLPFHLSVCLLPFLFVLHIGITVCCTLIVQSAGQIFAATTSV